MTMSLGGGIQRFLNEVDPKIFARGSGYWLSGRVEHMRRSGSRAMAEVAGSEDAPYLVELFFDEDGGVEAWDCSCPYDWGPVCKHTVAALLAIQTAPPEEPIPEEGPETISLQELVQQASIEQLAALVLSHCQTDKHFRSQVLSTLDDSGERELAWIKELVGGSIRSHTRRGYISKGGCDAICADLDDALDKAHYRIKRGQYGPALDVAQFVLLTGMELLASNSGSMRWTLQAALETIELAAKGLARSGAARGEWARKLLKTAQNLLFDGQEEWRYGLLRCAAVLADRENEDEFYTVLARLSDRRWENFQDTPRYTDQDKVIRYHILLATHGPEEANAYWQRVGIGRNSKQG